MPDWRTIETGMERDAARALAFDRLAERDAVRAYLADLPDPARFARYLPADLVGALLAAWLHQGNSWRVGPDHAALLRPWGLCEAGQGRCLTAFGIAVRRALKEECDG